MARGTNTDEIMLPRDLLWLADAPLFIDEDLVYRFYDAVVRPPSEEGTTTLEITEETAKKLEGRFNFEGSVSPSNLLKSLSSFLPFIDMQVKAEGEAKGEVDTSKGKSTKVELHTIKTPQRQLVSLVLHYLINQPDRLFLVADPKEEDWHSPEAIRNVPRALVFLDLPNQEEASKQNSAETQIIPIAAEFSNGKVERLYEKLTSKDGRELPPDYPGGQKGQDLRELKEQKKTYWQWFANNFSATKAIQLIEESAQINGAIKWIDYRLPISNNGDTLHLHISPAGRYDAGVFAYQMVKRGERHGLRIVGTLKSDPDMNVLAIYEK